MVVGYTRHAVAGRWYIHPKWGKMLCCGTTGGDWKTAFAFRNEYGQTTLKFIGDNERIRASGSQSWDPEGQLISPNWNAWNGGEMPVDGETEVVVQYSPSGDIEEGKAKQFHWGNDRDEIITAYGLRNRTTA